MKFLHPSKPLNLVGDPFMSKLAIVYHSAHGHTEFIARQVHAGASDGMLGSATPSCPASTAACRTTRLPIDWAPGRG